MTEGFDAFAPARFVGKTISSARTSGGICHGEAWVSDGGQAVAA